MPDLTDGKTVFYASILAKGYRKRSLSTYEVRLDGDTIEEAREKLKGLIELEKLREPKVPTVRGYNVHERNGMIIRSMYPCTPITEFKL